jgi:Tol biopolymer transport system component
MPLTPGARVGAYDVIAKLGEGGMGEVYRCRDVKLGREVALKILPAAFAADTERLRRFEREARTLAALNHPHIAQIYGVEDGLDESGHHARALVMELVEGPDLGERLKAGPLPLDEALSIARQVAEALEAAHEAGIIHRDLKPANIKIARDGRVKILDFGLAKAMDASAGDVGSVTGLDAATITSPAVTRHGMILGTATYMAPEQARGVAVDKRADIWAFGIVLFEMLTGRRLFDGATVSDALAAVLRQDIDLSALPSETPPYVRRLLTQCLVRDPRQRLRDIGDARLALESPGEDDDRRPAPARGPSLLRVGISLVAVAAAAAAAGWFARPQPPSAVTRLSIALPPGERITTVPAISRDGRMIAFAAGRSVAASRLYLRSLDDFSTRAVGGSDAARYPFFSPDGRYVGFFSEGKLRRATVEAPVATDLARAPEAWGGSWGDDGQIVYVPMLPAGIWRVPADGGTPVQLTKPDGADSGYAHMFPQHIAGSADVLFGYWGRTFFTARLSTATATWTPITRPLPTQGLFVGTHAASGHLLAGDTAAGVRAAPWTPATAEPVAPETQVLTDVHWETTLEKPWLSVSESGTVVYAPGNPARRRLVWVDRQGAVTGLPGDPDEIIRATVSRDGRRVAYDVNRLAQWVVDLATGERRRITSDVRSWHGGWLPGDQRLVVASNRTGDWDLYTVSTSGSGDLTPLLARPLFQFPQAVSSDGTIVFSEDHPENGQDLWLLTTDGRTTPLASSPFNETEARFSPDGRWVVYASDESGRYEVYARPVSGSGSRVAISRGGGSGPIWSRDGREIFYREVDNLVSVDVKLADTVAIGERRTLLDLSGYETGLYQQFDVSGDGQRFLLIRTDPAARPTRLDVIINWFSDLRRQVGDRP